MIVDKLFTLWCRGCLFVFMLALAVVFYNIIVTYWPQSSYAIGFLFFLVPALIGMGTV